jgi:peptide/nickel transport system permease protein
MVEEGARRMPMARRLWQTSRELPVVPLVIILAVLVLPAIFAEHLAPHSPFSGSLRARLQPPAFLGGSSEFLLGTDAQGRDVLSRIIFGARVSAIVAGIGIVLGGVVGIMLGVAAGYFGGFVDAVISRAVDTTLSVPVVLVAIAIAAAQGPSFGAVIGVTGLFLWSVYARQIRAETLKWKEAQFVKRAKITGASHARIVFVHLLPNMVNTIIVLVTLQVGFVIVFESSLSFMGVGIPQPNPAWGLMVAEGRVHVISAWWIAFFPGLAIMLTVLAFNLVGDWLRDRLDPRLRQV